MRYTFGQVGKSSCSGYKFGRFGLVRQMLVQTHFQANNNRMKKIVSGTVNSYTDANKRNKMQIDFVLSGR
jgi:hypothetical protein